MTTIAEVADAMQTVLTTTAETAARTTGFVQRQSKLSGAVFTQTLVLGWLQQPQASLAELTQVAASLGVTVTPQGLDQRFTAKAAACLRQVLDAAAATVIAADPVAIPVLRRFSAVAVDDSTTVSLPTALAVIWRGSGNGAQPESGGLKLQVRWDLLTGRLQGPWLQEGRAPDQTAPTQQEPLPAGALRLTDLGFFSLDVLRRLDTDQSFFLSRLQVRPAVYDTAGQRLDLPRWLKLQGPRPLDVRVVIGVEHRLPVRLLAMPVPEAVANERRRKLKEAAKRKGRTVSADRLQLAGWTILVTNAPPALLTLEEALVLYRVRWQVELLFKLWKQHGQLATWRSAKPWRILCEVYAKLLALVIQHWVLLVGSWAFPHRSLVKAAQTVRRSTMLLASALVGLLELTVALEQICRCLAAGCRMNRRKQAPNTYQLLLDLPEVVPVPHRTEVA